MDIFNISFTFDWLPVLKNDGTEYHFPDNYQLIDKKYTISAIYKWTVYEADKDDLKIVYIGEAEILRKRIMGYLNPGPSQQTNIRLNKLFNDYLNMGKKISLEILSFEDINLNGVIISGNDVNESNIRKAIEQLFITIYKKENYTLLNRE